MMVCHRLMILVLLICGYYAHSIHGEEHDPDEQNHKYNQNDETNDELPDGNLEQEIYEESRDDSQDGAITDVIEKINRKAYEKAGKSEPFEGDIELGRGGAPGNDDESTNAKQDAVIHSHRKWPKYGSYVYIPYAFDRLKPVSSLVRKGVYGAVTELRAKTCIRLYPRRTQRKYIRIYRGPGCSSPIGMQSYGGRISLANGCWRKDIAIHEFFHALGFWHEQSRPDRDRYVRILWQNIIPSKKHNFRKYDPRYGSTYGYGYDRLSLMHYGKRAFSRNGRNTIEWRANRNYQLGGQRMTDTDIGQLNRLYRCPYARCRYGVWYNWYYYFCYRYKVYRKCGWKIFNPTIYFCWRGRLYRHLRVG